MQPECVQMALYATTLPSARCRSSAGSPDVGSVKRAALLTGNDDVFASAAGEEGAAAGVARGRGAVVGVAAAFD